ncbi:MAG: hypothetical protein AABX37_05580, partial [Nanoarchaeota archaeon]
MQKISFLIFLILLSVFTYQRNSAWTNEFTLWKGVVLKTPGKIIPHINLGNAYIRRNALDMAEKEFLSALEINELDIRAHSGLGTVY